MTPLPDQSQPHTGLNAHIMTSIGLICAALLCFSLLDTGAKWLSPRIGALETAWTRYVVSIALVSLVLNPWRTPGVLKTHRPWLQGLRSLTLLVSTVLNFLALQHLQLAQATSILFATPLVVALMAGPMLGEWVGPRRLVAIGVGFLGVLLVAKPGLGGIHPAALYSVAGVFMYALYNVLTRVLAAHDSSATTMFYSGIVGGVLLTPVMPFIWRAPTDTATIAVMGAVGAFAALGHWFLILAHRHTAASTLAPFMYTQIIWMIMLGYIVFNDVPDAWTLLGAAIVIASGLYLAHRERVRGVT